MKTLAIVVALMAAAIVGLGIAHADNPDGFGTYAAKEVTESGKIIGPPDVSEIKPLMGEIAGSAATVDSDMDGCTDAEEIEKGLNPNSFFDFPDVASIEQGAGVGDGEIDAFDAQQIAFRWGATSGSPLYNVAYDRSNGTMAGGPDGQINILDLQWVYGRFAVECEGVPVPTIAEVCEDLKQEALSDGYSNFSCGGEGAGFPAGGTELPMKMRSAQVIPTEDNKGVMIVTQDLDITGAAQIPAGGPAGGKVGVAGLNTVPHPPYCDTHACHVWYEAKAEIRHLFGYGPNCAWFKLRQEHDEFSPWAAIYNVQDPIVWGQATIPCEDDNMEWSQNLSGLPTTLRSRGEVDWTAGVPTPWGYIPVRSWHAVIALTAYANYTYDFQMY